MNQRINLRARQVKELADAYGKLTSIPDSAADRLIEVLDNANNESLKLIYDARVKFLWMPARRRLIERGVIVPSEVAEIPTSEGSATR